MTSKNTKVEPWLQRIYDARYEDWKRKVDDGYKFDAAEAKEAHDRQQLIGMKADLARERGFSWRDHRLWDRCRKELEADGNAVLLKAMADAERDPRGRECP